MAWTCSSVFDVTGALKVRTDDELRACITRLEHACAGLPAAPEKGEHIAEGESA